MISRDDNDGRFTVYSTLPETNMKIPTKKYPKMMDFKVKGDSFLNIDISGM